MPGIIRDKFNTVCLHISVCLHMSALAVELELRAPQKLVSETLLEGAGG